MPAVPVAPPPHAPTCNVLHATPPCPSCSPQDPCEPTSFRLELATGQRLLARIHLVHAEPAAPDGHAAPAAAQHPASALLQATPTAPPPVGDALAGTGTSPGSSMGFRWCACVPAPAGPQRAGAGRRCLQHSCAAPHVPDPCRAAPSSQPCQPPLHPAQAAGDEGRLLQGLPGGDPAPRAPLWPPRQPAGGRQPRRGWRAGLQHEGPALHVHRHRRGVHARGR